MFSVYAYICVGSARLSMPTLEFPFSNSNAKAISTHIKLYLTPRAEHMEQYRLIDVQPTSKGPLVPRKRSEEWVHWQTCVKRIPEEMRRNLREVCVIKRGNMY